MNVGVPSEPFLRKNSHGKPYYYFTYYDNDGKRHQKSTGKLRIGEARAEINRLVKQSLVQPVDKMKFKTYADGWWIWDECKYIQSKLNSNQSMNRTYAANCRRTLVNDILPYWGDFQLSRITVSNIEDWITTLKRKKESEKTAFNTFSVFSVMMKEAYRRELIQKDIINKVRKPKKTHNKRGTLTNEEHIKLFGSDSIIYWKNETVKQMCLLSSITGMRLGEIQALTWEDIERNQITVDKSWERENNEIKSTKSGSPRIVPIPEKLYKILKKFATENGNEEGFLFKAKTTDGPINQKTVRHNLYEALKLMGIDYNERKERKLCFHSFRHYINTVFVQNNLPLPIIQQVIGHTDIVMTKNYLAQNIQTNSIITECQNTLLESFDD